MERHFVYIPSGAEPNGTQTVPEDSTITKTASTALAFPTPSTTLAPQTAATSGTTKAVALTSTSQSNSSASGEESEVGSTEEDKIYSTPAPELPEATAASPVPQSSPASLSNSITKGLENIGDSATETAAAAGQTIGISTAGARGPTSNNNLVENVIPTLTTRAASGQQQQLANGTQGGNGQGNGLLEENGSPAENEGGGIKLPISINEGRITYDQIP